jgi:hypothetical protein
MLSRSLCISALVLGLAGTSALSSEYQANPPSTSKAMYSRHQHGTRLPRELKMVWRQEQRSKLKALPKEQRHGWLKAQWRAMTDKQREVKIAELETKWNALPANVRQSLMERKQQRHQARQLRKGDKQANQIGDESERM